MRFGVWREWKPGPCSEILVEAFDVNGDQVANGDVGDDVLYDVGPVEDVNVREDGFEHEEDAPNGGDGHLFAGGACDDQFAGGEEERGGFRLVDADGDGSKAFFVVGAIWDAARDHVEVDFVVVGVDVNGGDHVVCGGGGVVFVGAEFLAHVFVVKTFEQSFQTLVFGKLLILHEGVSWHDIGRVLLGHNVAVLALAHRGRRRGVLDGAYFSQGGLTVYFVFILTKRRGFGADTASFQGVCLIQSQVMCVGRVRPCG